MAAPRALLFVTLAVVAVPLTARLGARRADGGRHWATVENDGTVRVDGRGVGHIEPDGTVRRDGRVVGEVEKDGTLRRDGRVWGCIRNCCGDPASKRTIAALLAFFAQGWF